MSGQTAGVKPIQQGPFEPETTRSLLDQLFADSKLYTRSKDYQELLNFVSRLRNFAPFNAMLLQVQKPGLSYAASARDWNERFGRFPKEGARPLLILWPFGPVSLVYDVMDTEGKEVPEDVASFHARGDIDELRLKSFMSLLKKKDIDWHWLDAGDQSAGAIRVVKRPSDQKEATQYRILINRNHGPAVQFVTLTHELGHLFLGHLGRDKNMDIPDRGNYEHFQQEIEAESVAYIVCERNGVMSKSHPYLSSFVNANTTFDNIDVYQVMRAAGRIETLLGLSEHTRY